ncbi:MAG: sigma-70 family RNA polymerase sigma factor [Bacteroidetes bacterium]|nr:sigma-70 family RNA polymerase sigma factor [Bacteroidota bacterium]
MITNDLIDKCVRDDVRAQLEMHEVCFRMLMPVCYKFVRNEEMARELYNQGFLKILDALKYFDKSKDFTQWAKKIMMNKLIDDYRSKKSLQKLIDENLEPDFASNTIRLKDENTYIAKEEEERVDYLLAKLPETTRRVFRLFALEGYSHQEISDLMKMSTGTSKWHVSNAREMLKRFVTKNINVVSNE